MKNKIVFVLIFFLTVSSCTYQQEQKQVDTISPKVAETKGYIVPCDSISPPSIVLAGKPKIVPAGKPKIIRTNSNIHQAGKPEILIAGKPEIRTPGQGTFLIPQTVPAVEHPVLANIPESIDTQYDLVVDQNLQNINSFSKLHGIKQDFINCMLQDKIGNLWFGTSDGLSKYDGKAFTHFTKKEGLLNRIKAILEDRNGNLWIGVSKGVIKYNGKTFTHFTEKEGLANSSVRSIFEDKNGILWFGTSSEGVVKYDGKTFTHFTKKEGLLNDNIWSIIGDRKGNIWFGTSRGVTKYDGRSFSHFTKKEGLAQNVIKSILEDRNGNIWFGTHAGGVSKYDGKTFTNFTDKEGLSNNSVWSILEDYSGNIWFGTSIGVNKYDGKTFTHFTEKEGLSNNIVWSILEDQNRNIWLGTYGGGVSKYNGKTFTHYSDKDLLSKNSIRAIFEDRNGNLWFGTSGRGVSKYDGKSFTQFTMTEGLSNNYIWSIFEDKNGNLWFGTYGGGVSKYDGKTFTHYTKKEGLLDNNIRSIFEDKDGNLWFGTSGRGVSKYDGKTFAHYTKKEGLLNNSIWSIIEDQNGNIWFGTSGGASKYNGETFTHYTEKEGLLHNFVRSILEDHSGNLWFGTSGGGISKFDGKTFTHFTEKEGLLNNYIFNIIFDKNKNLWIGTRDGLCMLAYDKMQKLQEILNTRINSNLENNSKLVENEAYFTLFSNKDGFLDNGVNRSKVLYEARDGTIWIGREDRLTAYHPIHANTDTIPPNIQLTDVKLFNEKIRWRDLEKSKDKTRSNTAQDTCFTLENGVAVRNFRFAGTTKWYGLPNNLSLAHDNNYLTFQYVGITQIQSRSVKYQYMLEGIDKSWSSISTRNETTYANLSHGKYTFKVKAMNSEGYWSKEYAYNFTIRPPWYKTLLFRITIWVITITALFTIYFSRVASLKKRQKHLERIVNEKTAEIVQQKDDLLAVNEELMQQTIEIETQKKELEVINATKDKFFSIIAHDLRSPFSSFLGFTEILAEELPSMSMENVQKLAKEMWKSATNLFHLLENLLHWSRMQRGLFSFELKAIDLLPTVDESVSLVMESAKNKGIKLSKNVPKNLTVYADRNVLEMVFRNLLSNAIKFTKSGGEISLSGKTTENNFVEICIKDTGIGMSEELVDNLFRIDVKTNRKGTAGESSSGLGLIICKDFIEKQGGKLWVESKEGVGSTFCFSLPSHS